MKLNLNSQDPMLRALYIILVPIVVLIIILNSGMLQKVVPAASVHGDAYSVVRYNFYYFEYYNAFLEENEDRLDELGYNPKVSDTKQYTSGGLSWKAFFLREAEKSMAETAYYCDLAEAAGYVFSEEELLPVQERLEEHAASQAANNINVKNYYEAYYGSGMTEDVYTAELTRVVKAQAYKNYLISASASSRADVDAYIAQNAVPDYRTADIRVITLDAQPDRETGEVGQEQLDALSQKLDRLVTRYQAGESFESLQAAFSTKRLGDSSGYLYDATRLDLPENIAYSLLLGGLDPAAYPNGLPVGGLMIGFNGSTAYFLILDAWGGSGPEREAELALGTDELIAQADEEIAKDYQVVRHRFGMLLATA